MSQGNQQRTQPEPLQSGYLDGQVLHHRFRPKVHRFSNRMYWHLVDVKRLDHWQQASVFRSCNRFNVYAFQQTDYVNKDNCSIQNKIEDYINQQSGASFQGKVLLMSHPRFFNRGFNSVNFYFCYQQHQLCFIVSEINNTPWAEKQLYFHDCRQQQNPQTDEYTFDFDKRFHISPFVSMDIHYQWRFKVNATGVDVHMTLFKNDETLMYVSLKSKWLPPKQASGLPMGLKRPAQGWKMWLNIYLQAAMLWLKKIPFYNHPNKQKP